MNELLPEDIILGQFYKDTITGFEGRAIAKVENLTGVKWCILIQANAKSVDTVGQKDWFSLESLIKLL